MRPVSDVIGIIDRIGEAAAFLEETVATTDQKVEFEICMLCRAVYSNGEDGDHKRGCPAPKVWKAIEQARAYLEQESKETPAKTEPAFDGIVKEDRP